MIKVPSATQRKTNRLALSLLAAVFAALTINTASAELTFLLTAASVSGGGSISNGNVIGATTSTVVTIDAWAQITASSVGNNTFGLSTFEGGITSAQNGANPFLVGALTNSNFVQSPFTGLSPSNGTLTVNPTTGSTDINGTGTGSNTSYVIGNNAPGNGTQVGATSYATNLAGGATFQSATDSFGSGYRFLIGVTTYTVTSAASGSSIALNWAVPPLTGAAGKGAKGGWTQGDGNNDSGNLQSGSLGIGTALDITAAVAVPEPATWAMLVGGFGALVGIQRIRRKTA